MRPDVSERQTGSWSDLQVAIVAYVAAFLLIVGAVAAAWLFYAILLSAQRQTTLGDLVFAQRDALLQLVNQETGVRGFVATGDRHFLKICYDSQPQLQNDLRTIRHDTKAVPVLERAEAAFLRERTLVEKYFDSEISLERAEGGPSAVKRLANGRGLFDALRAADAAALNAELAARERQRDRTLFLSRLGTTVSAIFCTAVLALAAAFTLVVRRSRAYRASSLRDTLTGAGNREYALRLMHRLAREHQPFGVVFIDLDGFKKINDNHGHATGDEMLKAVVSRLRGELREGDAVCRLGGDEFVCVVASHENLETIALRLQRAVDRPYGIGDEDYIIGSSAGFAAAQPGMDPAALLRRADEAMYAAKGRGGGVRAASL